jgi:predicted lipid-binding transport protein (Tim44 family)
MDNSQLLEIVLFAAVAGFLLFRLRSVLGRRTGNERRPPDPLTPLRRFPVPQGQPIIDQPPSNDTLPTSASNGLTGIAAVRAADPTFDEAAFLKGARGAFELILRAFAAGDVATLQPLLSKDVLSAFSDAITARQAAHETLQTTLVGVKAASIVEATVEGATGLVTVKLLSDQINVTHSADGKVVEGDPQKVIEKTDFWTFSRALRSRDPNWTLVATQSP